MSKPKVLVLGATGQVGKLLGDHLKDDSSLELIVGTRKKRKIRSTFQAIQASGLY